MNRMLWCVPVLCAGLLMASGQTPGPEGKVREVHGQTIVSPEFPAAELTIAKTFRYVGAQTVNLYGNADAEQHVFVEADKSGNVQRTYWIQFEHFLPTNKYKYEYDLPGKMEVGGVEFTYDVKTWANAEKIFLEEPKSDGAAIIKLFESHDLRMPKNLARVRMFHLPTEDRRSELMIIYGEAVNDDSKIPVGPEGTDLDKDAPEIAKMLADRAKAGITIRKK